MHILKYLKGTALVINNSLCGVSLIHKFLPGGGFPAMHLGTLSVAQLYISALFGSILHSIPIFEYLTYVFYLNDIDFVVFFLVKSKGVTEEAIGRKDNYVHIAVWAFGILYGGTYMLPIVDMILSSILLLLSPCFSIFCVVYIILQYHPFYTFLLSPTLQLCKLQL